MNRLTMAYGTITVLVLLVGAPSRTYAQSGDVFVDSYIMNPYYQHRAGNNTSPSNLVPSLYGGFAFQMLDCGFASAPAWEQSCPSDLSYAPNAHTGGYQAFGVAYKNFPAEDYYEYYCYIAEIWEYDWEIGDWVLTYQLVCEYQHIVSPAQVAGIAVGRIRWGNYQAPDLAIPLSTSAFKGASLPQCTPELIVGTAPCQGTGTYVAGAGYEDKILITDTECPLFRRTGLYSDFWNGCLHAGTGSWFSDLPSAYGDTTASDTASPFVVGVGTPNAAALVEGYSYTWRTYFGKGNSLRATYGDARHNGAVTVKKIESPFCSTFAGTFGEAASCYFNVDQTGLGPSSPFL